MESLLHINVKNNNLFYVTLLIIKLSNNSCNFKVLYQIYCIALIRTVTVWQGNKDGDKAVIADTLISTCHPKSDHT